MGKKFIKRRECGRKIKYATHEKAQKELRRLDDPALNAYQCRFCHRWHIGHTPKRIRDLTGSLRGKPVRSGLE